MPEKKYMISVITPVLDREKYIEKCILNVISQNAPEAEHIIIDGGSRDQTVEIVKRYAEKYPHIRWISETDHGQSDAMNKGLAHARGQILSFLNVDDYYEPGALLRVEEIFKTLPEPGLLVGNCNVWDENNHLLYVNKPCHLKFQDLLLGCEIYMFPVNPSAYFYHKSLHERIGLYDLSDNYSMDLDFILRAVQIANVKYVDEIFGNFRFIPGTKTFEDQKNQGCSRANILYEKYAAQLGYWGKIQLFFRNFFYRSVYFIARSIHRIINIF